MATGGAFMRNAIKAFPYQIRIVLSDNGVAFTKNALARWDGMRHVFDRACDEHGIEHRLTRPYHPWTNGQAERTGRTVKDATIKVFHYETLQALCAHVTAFVAAYNFAKHLKALRWRTPFQAICDAWKADPTSFKIDPHHLIPGPSTQDNQVDNIQSNRLSAPQCSYPARRITAHKVQENSEDPPDYTLELS